MGVCYEDIFYDTYIGNKIFDFFWNVLNIKTIKLSHTITIDILNYPVCSYWFIPVKTHPSQFLIN